jgi:hypothetical protein
LWQAGIGRLAFGAGWFNSEKRIRREAARNVAVVALAWLEAIDLSEGR